MERDPESAASGTGLRRTAAASELALPVASALLFLAFVTRTALLPACGLVLALLLLRSLLVWRGVSGAPGWRPGRWLMRLRPAHFVPILAGLALLLVADSRSNPLAADGPLLYAQLRSAVLDGDLDLANEFEAIVPSPYQHWAEEARRRGRAPDPNVEPGPALLWAPFFVTVHVLVSASHALGVDLGPADGYSAPYLRSVAFASLIWASMGASLLWLCLRRFFGDGVTAATVTAVALASPLVWYATLESGMPHATGFFAGCLLVWTCLRVRECPQSTVRWTLMAVAGTLGVISNRADAALLLLPLLFGAEAALRNRSLLGRQVLRPVLRGALVVLVAALLSALPYALLNVAAREGSVLRIQGLFSFTLANWAHPALVELLFSTRNGLFPWMPLALVGVLGLVAFLRRQPFVGTAVLATLAFSALTQAASYDWTGGWSFGARRFTSCLPILAFGVATVVGICQRRPWLLLGTALAALVGFNASLVDQVADGRLPHCETISFSAATSNAVQDGYRITGYPPTFPVTAFLSWRYGIPPGRFDRILGTVPVDDGPIGFGTPADETVRGRGWSPPHHDGAAAYRWAIGESSTLLLTLAGECDRTLSIRAAAPVEAYAVQRVTVVLNGERIGAVSFDAGWSDVEVAASSERFRRGLNELSLHSSWTHRSEAGPLVKPITANKPLTFRLAAFRVSSCSTR